MTVTFCGSDDFFIEPEIEHRLTELTEKLILKGAKTFYHTGGCGDFSTMSKRVLLNFKKKFPEIEIVLILACRDFSPYTTGFDRVFYPDLEETPTDFAFDKRNKWMVENADCIVSYSDYSFDNAFELLNQAKQNKKEVIIYRELEVL